MVRYYDKFLLSALGTQANTFCGLPIEYPKQLANLDRDCLIKWVKLSSDHLCYLRRLLHIILWIRLGSLTCMIFNLLFSQCTPYLDPVNCTTCLKLASQDITECCSDKRWAMIWTPKCLVSLDTYIPYSQRFLLHQR